MRTLLLVVAAAVAVLAQDAAKPETVMVTCHAKPGADAGLRLVTRGARPSLAKPPARRLPWMVLSGGWRVLPHVAVIVSGGRALEDPVRGMPATRYASAALRVTLGRERRVAATTRESPLPAHSRSASNPGCCGSRASWESHRRIAPISYRMFCSLPSARSAAAAFAATRPCSPGWMAS